jgi:hypothetical protein
VPGQRADGMQTRGIPLHKDLWSAAKAKADAEGRPLVAVIRELLQAYVDGKVTLPPT